MSKIIRNGIEYGGTATTANQVQYSPTETVADKIDELDGAIGAIPSITYKDISVTTGSTTYSGYYYVDTATSGNIVAAFVISTTSNVLAVCQRISANTIRVYSYSANTTATVRVLLSDK